LGCTITRVAGTLGELLKEFESQVLAATRMGLWPDSELIVINPRKDSARIFRVNVKTREEFLGEPIGVDFVEVESGRAFHVGMAGRYGPKPDENQIVGTVHVGYMNRMP